MTAAQILFGFFACFVTLIAVLMYLTSRPHADDEQPTTCR